MTGLTGGGLGYGRALREILWALLAAGCIVAAGYLLAGLISAQG
ncbi:hypothetical protein [Methylobacterium sp. ID0610]